MYAWGEERIRTKLKNVGELTLLQKSLQKVRDYPSRRENEKPNKAGLNLGFSAPPG